MARAQDVLDTIEEVLLALTDYDADAVILGAFKPTAPGRTYINVTPLEDHGDEIDGYSQNRKLLVLIACHVKIDVGSSDKPFKQLQAEWEVINNALEQLQRDNVEGLACKMEEQPPGVQWDRYGEDNDTWAFVGVIYEIEYERALDTNP